MSEIENRNIDTTHWSLDKRVPLSLIFALLVYLIAGIWSYTTLLATVKHNHEMMVQSTQLLDEKLDEKNLDILRLIEQNQVAMLSVHDFLESKIVDKTVDRFHKSEALEHIKTLQVQINNNNKNIIDTNRRLEICTAQINNKLDRLIERGSSDVRFFGDGK